jgi:hypothetical protein
MQGRANLAGNQNTNANGNTTATRTNSNTTTTTQNEDGTIPSGTGTEKEKPAAGKGNVQGKALFNEQPAVGVEVKLCKTFNRFMGGCTAKALRQKPMTPANISSRMSRRIFTRD